jgi:hypothetical protein
MKARFLACGVLIAAAAAVVAAQGPAPAAADQPTLDVILMRAGKYVQNYEKDFAGIVAEERYEQTSRQGGRFDQFGSIRHDTAKRRVFRSDLLLVRPEGADSWLQFRDVFEVDGRLVRDRNDRLAKLFLEPNVSIAKQVQRIRDESSRYNVGSIVRNVNMPVMALAVLKPENQIRFFYNHVEAADAERTDGAWAIDYREVGVSTMIKTNGEKDMPIEGRLWIEPATGRVLGTIMRAQSDLLKGVIQVDYEFEESLGILVPRRMHEEYRQYTDGSGVTAVATYSNFRRFQVKVDEQMAPTKPQ